MATAFIDSRAAGTSTNLSAYSVIQTGGYATAGDGGGATFKNVGSTTLLDSGASFVDSAGPISSMFPSPLAFMSLNSAPYSTGHPVVIPRRRIILQQSTMQ